MTYYPFCFKKKSMLTKKKKKNKLKIKCIKTNEVQPAKFDQIIICSILVCRPRLLSTKSRQTPSKHHEIVNVNCDRKA